MLFLTVRHLTSRLNLGIDVSETDSLILYISIDSASPGRYLRAQQHAILKLEKCTQLFLKIEKCTLTSF